MQWEKDGIQYEYLDSEQIAKDNGYDFIVEHLGTQRAIKGMILPSGSKIVWRKNKEVSTKRDAVDMSEVEELTSEHQKGARVGTRGAETSSVSGLGLKDFVNPNTGELQKRNRSERGFKKYYLLVAKKEGKIVGVLDFDVRGGEKEGYVGHHIDKGIVHQDYRARKQGNGTRIFEELMRAAIVILSTEFRAESILTNPVSEEGQKSDLKNGFREITQSEYHLPENIIKSIREAVSELGVEEINGETMEMVREKIDPIIEASVAEYRKERGENTQIKRY